MGQRALIGAWAARIAFAALIVAAIGLQLAVPAGGGAPEAMRRAGIALARAGYRVGPVRQRLFRDGERRGAGTLTARHAGCGQAVSLRALPIMDRFDVSPEHAAGIVPRFVFGGWQGTAAPARWRLVAIQAWIQARAALRPGGGWRRRPMPALLVIADPSACLAITAPDWASIWFG